MVRVVVVPAGSGNLLHAFTRKISREAQTWEWKDHSRKELTHRRYGGRLRVEGAGDGLLVTLAGGGKGDASLLVGSLVGFVLRHLKEKVKCIFVVW